MLLRIISLSTIILLFTACGDSSNSAQQTPEVKPAEPAKTQTSVMDAQRNALDKAKEVQGVVDNTANAIDEAVEKNTQ